MSQTPETRPRDVAGAPIADETPPQASWTGGLLKYVLRVCLVLLLYTLSIGPMYWHWYASRVGITSPALAVFYAPLEILALLIGPFGEWMDWYVNLWIV